MRRMQLRSAELTYLHMAYANNTPIPLLNASCRIQLREIHTHWQLFIVIIIRDSVIFYLILELNHLGQHPQGRCPLGWPTLCCRLRS